MWDKIVSAFPLLDKLFGTLDKAVTDKDKLNEIKLEILQTISGKGATSWLAANAFPLAMLVNFGLVVVLSLLNRDVPEWALIIALAWLAGPLLNTLSRETIGKIMELAKGFRDEQRKNKAGDNSSATKTGG
jgi:hypothetical protein